MTYTFAAADDGQIPSEAAGQGHGYEPDGTPLWVARASFVTDPDLHGIQIGKVRPGLGCALIPYGGIENALRRYEVLLDAGIWVPAGGGQVPAWAVVCGREENGDPIFVARAFHDDSLIPGKLRFAFGGASVGYEGREHCVDNYDVLVSQDGQVFP
jgi:hypothetical protein